MTLRRFRWFVFTLSSVSALLFAPQSVHAQACPGTQTGVGGTGAFMASSATVPGAAYNFVGTGCTGMSFGHSTIDCLGGRGTFIPTTEVYYTAFFQASFNSAANTTMNGCVFMCEGGTCIVRGGDALPAELMNFAIE